jgi:hypothetical protein
VIGRGSGQSWRLPDPEVYGVMKGIRVSAAPRILFFTYQIAKLKRGVCAGVETSSFCP